MAFTCYVCKQTLHSVDPTVTLVVEQAKPNVREYCLQHAVNAMVHAVERLDSGNFVAGPWCDRLDTHGPDSSYELRLLLAKPDVPQDKVDKP